MNKEYNTLYFLKKLDIWQARKLFCLALSDTHYYGTEGIGLEDITIQNVEEDKVKNTLNVRTILHRPSFGVKSYYYFLIDDYTMIIDDGLKSKDFSSILHRYLVSQFGEVYVNCLYEKRLEDALAEKIALLESTSKKKQKKL